MANRLRGAGVSVIALLVMGAIAGPAQASNSVPYTDPAVTGALGLCDSHGRQLTSGSTATQPFAALAVGSVAAPADYTGTGRGAVLYAYQPIENVPANAWSGEELTDNSHYTNAGHPMSAATGGDPALQHVVTDFPPTWDGLIQLRLYATAPGRPMDSTSYQALDIKVSGTSWQAVDGTTIDCTAGSAVSVETTLLPKSALRTPAPTAPTTTTSDGSTHRTLWLLGAFAALLAAASGVLRYVRKSDRDETPAHRSRTTTAKHLRERPLTMTSTLRRSVTAGVVGLLTAATFVVLGGAPATATTTPPWEPDANSVGGLLFFNAQGNQITGGSINDHPLAAFVEATTAVRHGDTNAVLSGYQPVSGEAPTLWNGDVLSGSTKYPNSSAPSAIASSSLPVVTGAGSDFTIADLEADYPTTSAAGYQNVYQLRLTTSAANTSPNTKYDSADILIDTVHSTWSVEYTKLPLTATSTALTVTPAKAVHGAKVTLTANVTPAVAGKVKFIDGTKVLSTVTASAGKATYSTTTLAGGTHKLKATFVPTATQTYAGSSSNVKSLTITAQGTTTTLKASKTTIGHGAKLTLTAAEKPATTGSVAFFDGSKKLGSATVKSGSASYSTTKLAVGSHKLKATFTPASTASYKASTSSVVTVKVTK